MSRATDGGAADATPTLASLGESRYLSLTTFRADGTPVATPVWLARDGDRLVVITRADSGKVRRIRADSRVRVAACDMRGRERGPQADGTATLLDEDASAVAARVIQHRYGLMGRVTAWFMERGSRAGDATHIGIAVTLD